MAVTYIRSDLDFILAQILIAERDAAGEELSDILPNSVVPFGLRTVDGSLNNLVPGQSQFGAADTQFPRLVDPVFRTAENGTSYAQTAVNPMVNPFADPIGAGWVIDSQPRIISNLIVDQTPNNPAAVAANGGAPTVMSPGLDGVFGTPDDTPVFFIPNTTPDEGLSAQFNTWMTFFGQFFDHGLDLLTKGQSGIVFIPLQPDDPLFDPTPGAPNFLILNRATNRAGSDGVVGTGDDIHQHENTTSPFVDQNQTYSSHPSHQVFLRAYELRVVDAGLPTEHMEPFATGRLITNRDLGNGVFGDGDDFEIGGMATWAVVKAQARDILGINLTDANVFDIPLLATDAYGNFLRGPNGFPQVVMKGPDGLAGTMDDELVEGNPLAPISLADAVGTGHAFLNDIAHAADPTGKVVDADEVGGPVPNPDFNPLDPISETNQPFLPQPAGTYDNELLDAHYIAGDGRVNENIGLTAVHHVFHAEHNRLVEHTKEVALADAAALLAGGATDAEAVAFLNQWLLEPVTELPVDPSTLVWNGERLFQSAKFGTEMQYQHLVFEEFARKVQPQVDVFLAPEGFDVTIDASIVAEFAHAVYRFGHSMLTETIDRLDPNFVNSEIGLIAAFLNPLAFAESGPTPDEAAGAIIRGVTRQAGNEIDEFVTEALRNNLLGLPLDLAAINIARGRDTGVPSLNAARRDFYAQTADSQLKPYASWADFVQHLKHPESLVNFIAAYGAHTLITGETTLEGKRAAAMAIVFGTSQNVVGDPLDPLDDRIINAPGDRLDFLNGTGAWVDVAGITATGVDAIDLWVGGLAEKQMPFGGLLGSTFNFVFETQLEALQNGDRFYYLARTAGMNFLNELENNSFAKLIMANTDTTHLPADVFSTPAYTLEVDPELQYTGLGLDGRDDPEGESTILTPLVIRDNPATPELDTNYLQYTGADHVVLGGTAGDDIMIASIGDDTLWGDGGDDRLEGGDGVDNIEGGDGDDIITDSGGDDVLKGNDGNDVISGGNGFNLIIGGAGSDFIITGEDVSETFGGTGNDFILGSQMNLPTFGNEGDDWIEIGTSDGAGGDNFDPQAASTVIGHDVFITGGGFDEVDGEGGDDIMVFSDGEDHFSGGGGFDWASYATDPFGVTANLLVNDLIEPPVTPSSFGILDRFVEVEGLSGSRFSDILRGDDEDVTTIAAAGALNGELTRVSLIDNLQQLLDDALGVGTASFSTGNIILGGDGSDVLEGRGGDDILDGDSMINVRIAVTGHVPKPGQPVITSVDSLTELVPYMLSGEINPSQLSIVREILDGTAGAFNFDTAVFSGNSSEYIITVDDRGTVDESDDLVLVADTIAGRDGVDRLLNMERIQFADRIADESEFYVGGINNEPVGVLTLNDTSPAVNQTLTASSLGITDADNVTLDNPTGALAGRPIAYAWQVELIAGSGVFTDIVGLAGGNPATASGNSFRVTPDLAGLALRVRAAFQDDNGVIENVFSAATDPVTGVVALPLPAAIPAETIVASPGGGLHLIRADLQFMLDQIVIAERNAAGESLVDLVPNTRLPFGLRTVDGTFNNLTPGQTEFGAADQNFPPLLDQVFRDDADGDTFDTNGPAPGGLVTNTDYASTVNVADADPRIISNLIVDQTANNPSAVEANGGNAPVISPGLDGVFGTADDRDVFFMPNTTPDEGLSAPFNAWFTFFGQFFDHGLDLVDKGGNGTVYIPLMPDDPLYVAGGFTNFMVVTRAANIAVNAGVDGLLGTSDDVHFHNNETTPFVDQNQTYTSHASHQVFLREYTLVDHDGNGLTPLRPVATGRLIDGAGGGIGNWAEVKAQAATMLGVQLTDENIFDVPLLATDAYGKFIPGPNGFAQFVTMTGHVEANPADNGGFGTLVPANALFSGHAFLNDIAHNAVPGTQFDPDGPGGPLSTVQADDDDVAGNVIATDFAGRKVAYDDELLDKHFITGDGRGNENIGLTSVHFVFHAEHNRMVQHVKDVAIASNDVAFLNEWLTTPVGALPTTQPQIDALVWNGERLFQAARFSTEMQYQHLVFEEFARKVQPQVDVFLLEGQGYDTTINPAIVAEFAHAVYRFGHSMLTETVDRFDPNFNLIDADPLHPAQDASGAQIGLIAAFLNPLAFTASGATPEQAAGAIIRGVTRQVGNEIDEFVTEALRNNLVGLPLDLPAINIARGRDTGVPTLNQARAEFYEWTGDTQLKPYASWADLVQHLRHPESLVNFIAAYGTHEALLATDVNTTAEMRAVATALVFGGEAVINAGQPDERIFVADDVDRLQFLNSQGPLYENLANGVTRTGVDAIDLWIGGLAEKQMPFGGLLGSTFNYVFENQMEKLQNGDRFYYLERTAGLNFLTELENNSFAKLIMANTDAKHLPGDVFSTPAYILEVDQSKQFTGIENVRQAIGEAGTATVTQFAPGQWHTVTFTGPIADAVVVMMVNTNGEAEPAVARVRNITATGFQFQVDEWEHYDEKHGSESLSWLAMSAGEHVLFDGTHIRAGVRAVDDTLDHVSFGTDFSGAPVVLTQVSSVVDGSTVTTRLTNVTAAGFDVRVQEEQLNEIFDPAHSIEQVGWIAIAQDVTSTLAADAGNLIGNLPQTVLYGSTFTSPVFLAQMQTQNDLDTAAVRGTAVLTDQATVFVEEEVSSELDTSHADEDVGFVALDTGVILPGTPLFNADPTDGAIALVIRNNPATPGPDTNYLQYIGEDHVVLGGTEFDDVIIASIGDDTIYGDGGNDRLEGGDGVDMVLGGAGDDIITDRGGDDNLQGQDGNDAIHGGNGINLILGGFGNDFIVTGEDSNESFGGPGNDFFLGTRGDEAVFGNEGDDWIERGMADGSAGENFDTRGLDSIIGNDVFMGDSVADRMFGEGGDDIMAGNGGTGDRYLGASGFDWGVFKHASLAANVDLNLRAFNEAVLPASPSSVLARYESIEGVSGSQFSDILRGDDLDAAAIAVSGFTGSVLTNIALIDGLQEFLDNALGTPVVSFGAGNIMLGGDGSDFMEGRGGDDIMDGDASLNVRIRVFEVDANGAPVLDGDGNLIEIGSANSMTELVEDVFAGNINPGQLAIVREILPGNQAAFNFDTAVFSGVFNGNGVAGSEYTVEIDDGGTVGDFSDDIVTVTDLVAARDGTDTLTHFERLQFANQSVILVPGLNAEPAGLLTILDDASGDPDTTPTEDQTLRVSIAGVTDGDNVTLDNPAGAITGPIEYVWQVELAPGTGVFSDVLVATGLGDVQATGPIFTPGDDLVGLALRVRATYQDANGVIEQAFSAPTAPVINVNDPPVGTVLISDPTPTEGEALTAINAFTDADGLTGAIFEYQWAEFNGVDFVPIDGAIFPFFIPEQLQVGRQLQVTVTYIDDQLTTESLTSLATAEVVNVNDLPLGTLDIDDLTPGRDQLLTAVVNFTDEDGLGTLDFQWQSSADGIAWDDIPAATGDTFLTTEAEIGLQLRVFVTYTDGFGMFETVTSDATLPVNAPPLGTVDIDNTTPAEGDTLTASNAFTDADGLIGATFEYQWAEFDGVDWVPIASAILPSFIPEQGQVGRQLQVTVTYTDDQGQPESLTSLATAEVANVNDLPLGTLDIDDPTPGLAQLLTAVVNFTDEDGLGTFSFQWQSSADGTVWNDIGTDSNTFLTTAAEIGLRLQVIVTYTDAFGAFETVTSAPTTVVGDIIDGTGADETLNGTEGSDTINGFGGADTLNGLGGDDTLDGGAGNDNVNGGAGNDTINFTTGQEIDTTDGGDDTDTMNLLGTGGNNTLRVLFNGTVITNVAGGSVVNVESFNADLGVGTDTLSYDPIGAAITTAGISVDLAAGTGTGFVSIAGVENVTGGSGGDNFAGDANNNTFVGQGGVDTYTLAATNAGATILQTSATSAEAGTDTLSGIENFIGSQGDDTITVNGAVNLVDGQGGADTINAGGANDTILGGTGDDTIVYVTGSGADTIDGGADTDTLTIVGTAAANTVTVAFDGTTITGVAGGSVANVENVTIDLLGGTDSLSYGTTTAGVTVNLTAATASGFTSIANVENVTGGGGNDVLTGRIGANTLSGGGGADRFVATIGDGNDTYNGGTGADTYDLSGTTAGATVTTGSASSAQTGVDTLTSIANFIGSQGNDSIIVNGGVNVIDGQDGNDTINAGGGADTVTGGLGNDIMNGGTGNDTFIFAVNFGDDTITGFDALPGGGGQDILRLDVSLGIDALNFIDTVDINDAGADTLIVIDGGGTITLLGVAAANVTIDDFVFGT